MFLIARHQEVCVGAERALEDSVVRIVAKDAGQPDARPDQCRERGNFGKGFLNLGRAPAEGVGEDRPELGPDRGGIKQFDNTCSTQGQDRLAVAAEEDGRHIDVRVGYDPDHPRVFRRPARNRSSSRWRSSSVLSPRRLAVSAPHRRSRCQRREARYCRRASRMSSLRLRASSFAMRSASRRRSAGKEIVIGLVVRMAMVLLGNIIRSVWSAVKVVVNGVIR